MELDHHRAPRRRRKGEAPRLGCQGIQHYRPVLPGILGAANRRSAVRTYPTNPSQSTVPSFLSRSHSRPAGVVPSLTIRPLANVHGSS